MTERYLIVGLGNIGKQYENTRHNAGFWVVDELAQRHSLKFDKKERKAVVAEGSISGKRVLLAKPQTYMNLSGEAVRALVDFYKVSVDALIIIHDDLDTPFDSIKLRKTGGHGGQNGVRNIIQHLGTQDFMRLRFGIGRPPGKMEAVAYVLQPFTGDDAITAKLMTERAANAVETWLVEGAESAMSKHNGDAAVHKPKTNPNEELKIAQRAHELAPNDPKPLEKIAALYKQLGKLDDAVKTHLRLAELYHAAGNVQESVKQLERVASLKPDQVELHERIVKAYLAQDDDKKAVARYLILAEHLERKGDFAGALKAVGAAIQINPQHPKLANLYEKLVQLLTQ